MVVGPMKKRIIISFFVGFFVMLLITAVAIVLMYRQYAVVLQEKETLEKDLSSVCLTARTIMAGEEVTSADLVEKRINSTAIPANSYGSTSMYELELASSGTQSKKYAKIDIIENTILLESMLYENEVITDDMRSQEFNMILLPSDLQENDYIDIRLLLPTGNDYVVCSKKRVERVTEQTIWLNLGELDMQYISSALIESYLTEGSILSAAKYIEPGIQKPVKVTYPILPAVKGLIQENPNLVEQIKIELSRRLSTYEEDRKILDANSSNYRPENPVEVLTTKVQEQIQKQMAERQSFRGNGQADVEEY